MKTTQLILLGILLVSVYSQNCGSSPCGPNQVCDRIGTHTSANCISETYASGTAECAAGYTDDTTGAAATTSGTFSAGCVQCLSTYALNAKTADATKCIVISSATETCLTGYTDDSNGGAATAVSGNLAGNCDYCVASTHALNAKTAAATKCIVKASSTETCLTGYTDNSAGTAATAVGSTLAGNCNNCAPNYFGNHFTPGSVTLCISASTGTCIGGNKNHPTTADACIDVTSATNCKTGAFKNHPTEASATACIANSGTCASGVKNHPTTADACIDVTSATNCKTGAFKNHATAASATACIDATTGTCASGVKNHPTTADACIDVTSATNCKTGAFKNHATVASATGCIVAGGTCASGTVKNAKEGDHDACILSAASTTNKCKEGYTDVKDGDAVKTTGTLTDCVFCASGYKENTTTKKCEKSSGQMIAYGFMLLFVLLSVLF